MKRYLLLFTALWFLSCDDQLESKEPKPPCERAQKHIVFCVGYLPSFTCTGELAEKILNTSCENITSLWR